MNLWRGFFLKQLEGISNQYKGQMVFQAKGRGRFYYETDLGKRQLIPFSGSEERGLLLQKQFRLLGEKGCLVEQIDSTKEGFVLAIDEMGKTYLRLEAFEGLDCDVLKEEDSILMMEALARFHQASTPIFLWQDLEEGSVLHTCQKHERELLRTRNYMRKGKKHPDFLRYVLKCFPTYLAESRKAISMLEKYPEGRKCFCHGNCNHHSFLMVNKQCVITDLLTGRWDEPIVDLAMLFRKIMEKQNWSENGFELLSSYEEIFPFTENERKRFFALLLFPEKFWKLMNHYNRSSKTCFPEREMEKLSALMAQEEARIDFLQKLFSFL